MSLGDMEEFRVWCPDSSIKNLTSQRGEAFLKMLKTIMPTDDIWKDITEPKHIPHPIMDRIFTRVHRIRKEKVT